MSIDSLLVFIVVGLTCLLIGGMGGLFLGATSEQESFLEALARGNFTTECKTQVEQALRGGGAPPTDAQ